MRLVAEPLQQIERLALPWDLDGLALTRHIDLFEALRERRHRDLVLETELVHDPLRHAELPLASVDEEQLRRIGEPSRTTRRGAVALGEVRGEPAGEHLFHRREVVVAGDALHLEPAVVALLRKPVFHHDHRPDVVGALDVAHVVALDPQGSLGQAEMVLQLVQRAGPAVVIGSPLQAVPRELLLRVSGHGLLQRALVAALRHAHHDAASPRPIVSHSS